MIGLDTNVLVRYVTLDDPDQARAAVRLVDSLTADEPGFISLVVLAELAWVLETSYKLNRAALVRVLETLLESKELLLEQKAVVAQALHSFGRGTAGFVDHLIERRARAAGCTHSFTFDQEAAASAGMRLLR
jgi:predicted nucleic-acid-binding protein